LFLIESRNWVIAIIPSIIIIVIFFHLSSLSLIYLTLNHDRHSLLSIVTTFSHFSLQSIVYLVLLVSSFLNYHYLLLFIFKQLVHLFLNIHLIIPSPTSQPFP
jgi:hypothetical protein